MEMYKTGIHANGPIEVINVERQTDSSVWVNGRRESKISDYRQYHSTWDDAYEYLLKQSERAVNSARIRLAAANSHHGNIKGLLTARRNNNG